jgi:hypothetical protein
MQKRAVGVRNRSNIDSDTGNTDSTANKRGVPRLFSVPSAALLVLVFSSVFQTRVARAQNQLETDRGATVALRFLDAHNQPLDTAQDVLQVSSFITNGPTLPRDAGYDSQSLAPTDFRIEVDDPRPTAEASATLESRTRSGALRASLQLPLSRPGRGMPLRSTHVRLVADEIDHNARGAATRTLRVGLRDHIVVKYHSGDRALQSELRVGKPGSSNAPTAARKARLHVHILRAKQDGRPLVGRDDSEALSLMRAQLTAANEIWLQCNLSFGDPQEVAMEVVAPPPPTLLAVADNDGLPARGDGQLRFKVNGQTIGPVRTHAGATPAQTAASLALALTQAGFGAQVSDNLATRSGAGPSADVVVRAKSGAFVHIEPVPGVALSTDKRQTLQIGRVDLGDGLQEFDNMTAQVGSLEERTLIKTLADDDPQTIDVFAVNQFSAGTRQGEAFIAEPAGAITNVVVIDRNGLRQAPLAWTLAHELGHVLMDDPLHPDNVGPDRPWLLMDADSGRGTVDGPKRLRPEDCRHMRDADRRAQHALLKPFDAD